VCSTYHANCAPCIFVVEDESEVCVQKLTDGQHTHQKENFDCVLGIVERSNNWYFMANLFTQEVCKWLSSEATVKVLIQCMTLAYSYRALFHLLFTSIISSGLTWLVID
jgi:hypothetical protein